MDDVLIITNGSAAVDAIRAAGIQAHFCAWNDVLHDGPVPSGLGPTALAKLRASYFASLGWAELPEITKWFEERDARLDAAPNFREVVLWFEHDLYDQLQLVQILDRLSGVRANVTLIQSDTFITTSTSVGLKLAFELRRPVTAEQIEWSTLAWAAFTSPKPLAAQAVAEARSQAAMPHLTTALVRWFEMFPGVDDGLGRTERSVLRRIAAGLSSPMDLFRATSDEEEAVFRGDWSFWTLLAGLANESVPTIRTVTGEPFDPQHVAAIRLALTDAGRAVLAGEADRIELSGIECWRGGTHLTKDHHWRWSPSTGFVECP